MLKVRHPLTQLYILKLLKVRGYSGVGLGLVSAEGLTSSDTALYPQVAQGEGILRGRARVSEC